MTLTSLMLTATYTCTVVYAPKSILYTSVYAQFNAVTCKVSADAWHGIITKLQQLVQSMGGQKLQKNEKKIKQSYWNPISTNAVASKNANETQTAKLHNSTRWPISNADSHLKALNVIVDHRTAAVTETWYTTSKTAVQSSRTALEHIPHYDIILFIPIHKKNASISGLPLLRDGEMNFQNFSRIFNDHHMIPFQGPLWLNTNAKLTQEAIKLRNSLTQSMKYFNLSQIIMSTAARYTQKKNMPSLQEWRANICRIKRIYWKRTCFWTCEWGNMAIKFLHSQVQNHPC